MRSLRTLTREVETAGLTVTEVIQGKHFKLRLALKDDPDGPTRLLVAARTPSCYRGGLNQKAMIRRLAVEIQELKP